MSATRKVKWAILGTSWISSEIAEAFQKSDTSELIAIGSRDLNKAIEFAKKHNVKKFYGSYDKLLADPEVEAVYIGLPNHLHKDWIIRCIKAGKKAVLCEKPFVLNMQEADEVFKVLKQYDALLVIGLMYQFHPFIKHLLDVIESKKIGDVKAITAIYTVDIADKENTTAGGAILSLGCYPLSFVRLIAKDDDVESIQASGTMHADSRDNVSMLQLKFKNNITASITTSNNIDWWSKLTVFGTKGILDVETNPWLPGENNQYTIQLAGKKETINFSAEKPLYTYQIDCVGNHVLKELKTLQEPRITWEHTMGNVAISEEWLAQVKGKNNLADEKINSPKKRYAAMFK